MIAAVEKGEGAKGPNLKKTLHEKKEVRSSSDLPPFPCGVKKVVAILEQWVKDDVIICLRWKFFLLSKIRKIQSTVHTLEGRGTPLNNATP